MFIRRASHGLVLSLTTLGILGLQAHAQAQDTQAITAAGIKFQAPKSWKANPPRNTMRQAELVVAPVEGDKAPAELVLFVFPGGAGSVQANVQRWEMQFRDAQGKTVRSKSTEIKAKGGVPVTRVELEGTYVEPTFGQGDPTPKPGYRLLGGIVETPQSAYFFKMTGPDQTMKAAAKDFDLLLESIEVTRR
jgi:hypothetical protein